jgi:hypothetical protein
VRGATIEQSIFSILRLSPPPSCIHPLTSTRLSRACHTRVRRGRHDLSTPLTRFESHPTRAHRYHLHTTPTRSRHTTPTDTLTTTTTTLTDAPSALTPLLPPVSIDGCAIYRIRLLSRSTHARAMQYALTLTHAPSRIRIHTCSIDSLLFYYCILDSSPLPRPPREAQVRALTLLVARTLSSAHHASRAPSRTRFLLLSALPHYCTCSPSPYLACIRVARTGRPHRSPAPLRSPPFPPKLVH